MKTLEQHSTEVFNYLNQVSNHLYMNSDKTAFFRVEKRGEAYYEIHGDKEYVINVDSYINSYKENAKNVIKHRLFLDKNYVSVKRKLLDKKVA